MNRLRRNFLKDHPTSARRRDVQELLEAIVSQLGDTGAEAEMIRDHVRGLRGDFKIASEPAAMIENYEELRQRLEALTYGTVLHVQDDEQV
jgi:hypothetical protein